jgi:hypothetical protein
MKRNKRKYKPRQQEKYPCNMVSLIHKYWVPHAVYTQRVLKFYQSQDHIAHQLAGGTVIKKGKLLKRDNLLKMPLTYYFKQIHILQYNFL